MSAIINVTPSLELVPLREKAVKAKKDRSHPPLVVQAGVCASFGVLMLGGSGALSVISSDIVGMMVKNVLRSVESTRNKTVVLSSVTGTAFATDYFLPLASFSLGDMSAGVAIKTLDREWNRFLEGDQKQKIERSILWIGGSAFVLAAGSFTAARLGMNPVLVAAMVEALSTACKHLHKQLPATTRGVYAGITACSLVYDLQFSSGKVLVSALPLSLGLKEATRAVELWQQGQIESEEENGVGEGQGAAPQSQQILATTAVIGTNISLLTLFHLYSSAPALAVLAAGTGKMSTRLIRNMFRQYLSAQITVLVSLGLFASASLFYALKQDHSPMGNIGMVFLTTTAIILSQDVVKRWQLGKL